MRKTVLMSLVLLVVLAALGASVAAAQEKTPLEMGQWMEGTLTNDSYEVKYTINGAKGQIILVQMLPKPGTYDLDPALVLRNSDGDIVGQNDDYSYPLSVVVAELPSDDTYTILATRSGGKTGSSTGAYWVRADAVEPLKPGSKLDVTISSDSEKDIPSVYVLRPESSGPVKVGFSQKPGDLYASLDIGVWQDDSYPTSVMSLSDTAKVTGATFSVDLDSGQIYLLMVKRAFGAFSFNSADATVTVTVN
jgi:hypothetical protein